MNGLDPVVLDEAAAPSRLEPPKPALHQQASEEAIQQLLVGVTTKLKDASRKYQQQIEEENSESPDAADETPGSGGGMAHE